VRGGDLHLAVGTAGSATLVLQAVLPALLLASRPSRLTLEGGTHNPFAPPFEFLQRALLPLLARMGAVVTIAIERHGFYPAGGGRFTAVVDPTTRLQPLTLLERGPLTMSARAMVSAIPEGIATRELKVVHHRLGVPWTSMTAETITTSPGPGNALLIELMSESVTEVITGFGEKSVPAPRVAERACDEAREYIIAGVPVGVHLADQLLVPMALAGGGTFRTLRPSRHTTTNADVIRQFVEVPIDMTTDDAGACTVTVGAGGRRA
jgi:RNA 3'-terminal phosphate cyclase (ATP)